MKGDTFIISMPRHCPDGDRPGIEGRRVFEHLTVEENLKVGAHLRKTGPVKEGLELVYHYFPSSGRSEMSSPDWLAAVSSR